MMEDRVLDALGRIDGDMIEAAARLRGKRKKNRSHWVWRAAACLALVCSLAVTAEASSGAVSNLLAPVFGGARTEIVDGIGVPVGVSASADGYTVTVDAIIGDRYNVAVVYTLTREDGQPIPEGVRFSGWKTNAPRGGGGGSFGPEQEREDPCRLQFVEEWHSRGKLTGRHITVEFSGLVQELPGGEEVVLAEGPWELSYTLCYRDTTRTKWVRELEVTDSAGGRYDIDKIQISPLGVRIDMKRFDPVPGEGIIEFFEVALLLEGEKVPLEGGGGIHFTHGDKTGDAYFSARFESPVALKEIDGLVICGTVYPLDME